MHRGAPRLVDSSAAALRVASRAASSAPARLCSASAAAAFSASMRLRSASAAAASAVARRRSASAVRPLSALVVQLISHLHRYGRKMIERHSIGRGLCRTRRRSVVPCLLFRRSRNCKKDRAGPTVDLLAVKRKALVGNRKPDVTVRTVRQTSV